MTTGHVETGVVNGTRLGAAAATAAAIAWLSTGAANADVDVRVPNGQKVFGTLDPAARSRR